MRQLANGPAAAAAVVLTTLFVIAASGCLVVSGSSFDQSGVKVSAVTTGQIEAGVTTEDWIIATLGEPSTRTTVSETPAVAILKYEYTETKSEGGAVFLIFAGGSSRTRTDITYIEVTDGIVTRFWSETSA
ncbi:MAG: hypothetical protein ACYTGR_15865 [Planctomycetota bacterium]|jgi:hypothetical protein